MTTLLIIALIVAFVKFPVLMRRVLINLKCLIYKILQFTKSCVSRLEDLETEAKEREL